MRTNVRIGLALCAWMLLSGRGYAETVDPVNVLKALNENHARMVKAFVDRDAEAFATCWMPDAACAIEQLPLLRGKDQLCAVVLDAVGGSSMHGLERLNRRVWICGDHVYETGEYVHRYAMTGREAVQSSAKTFVTIWNKQPDGSWKREAEAWNNRPAPSAELLAEWKTQALQDVPVVDMNKAEGVSDAERESIREQLIELEQTFHDVFLADDVKPAIARYTDDARLLSGGSDWLVGKKQIRNWIMDGRKQAKLVGMDCETVASGVDGGMAYAVNRFHWTFTPVGGDQTFDFYGKGLHIWQRQPDGQWKILIDINNTNPPPGETP